jgi:hypothetical protein
MTKLLFWSVYGMLIAVGAPSLAASQISAEKTLHEYCEPLISGSSASRVTEAAKADGFKVSQVGGQTVLILGELVLGVSDSPLICMVQAPPELTFAQGALLVDAWAARHPGAIRGAATKGPDGAPVRVWTVPKLNTYMLVTEQRNLLGKKVLNFVMAPIPAR